MKICCSCPPDKAERPVDDFYKSYNSLHADHYVPMCKECIADKCYNEKKKDIELDTFKSILRQIDKPFVETAFQGAVNEYNKAYGGKYVNEDNRKIIISYYFKTINSLSPFRTMNWSDGIEYNLRTTTMVNNGIKTEFQDDYVYDLSDRDEDRTYALDDDDDFEVTREIINLFGENYKKSEYKAMWKKYDFLRKSYPDMTNLHVEALITYVRFKVKEEIATAQGNAIDAEKWNNAATKAAEKAKINPNQLSKSDLQGGLNSFSELSLMVEQSVDIVPILPKFKFRPNDAIDFNIWCLVNYIRDLEGKEHCSYKDVYAFYDKRKQEYIEQYGDPDGIFTDDTTELNRDTIKKFIKLPNDYNNSNIGEDDE